MNPLIASMMNQAVQYYQGGNLDRAEAMLKQVLQIHSRDFDALHLSGIVKGMKGDHAGATSLLKRAVAINPNDGFVQFNLAKALSESGDDAGSLQHHVKATRLAPQQPDIWVNYGRSLANLGRHADATTAYKRALDIAPNHVETLANLAASLGELARFEEALACCQKALDAQPLLANLWSNKGAVLRGLKRHDEALAAYDRALRLENNSAQAWFGKALVLNSLKRYEEALRSCEEALRIDGGDARSWVAKGYALIQLGRYDQARIACEKAISIKADLSEAWNCLGQALQGQGHLNRALECFARAIHLDPASAETLCNAGSVEQELGHLDQAQARFREALRIEPDNARAYGALLFLLSYHGLVEPREYLALARGWEVACVSADDRRAARERGFGNPPAAGRRLKVGYVSGDLRRHAVSFFVEQIFTCHDRGRIELFAYSTNPAEDAVTQRLRALVEHWRPAAGMTDIALRDCIEADGVDVLVDLSSHTAHGRPGVFARRAAPVQAHYLGYAASTGLTEMDYWIGDGIVTPPAAAGDFCEQIWRLPRTWVSYDGKDAPVPGRLPREDGAVWLGSFNNLYKLSPRTLALWARVMTALPEARLLLKTRELAEPANRRRVLDAMQAQGVAAERIALMDGSETPDWTSHMACYNRLDVVLDPVGAVGGGTTTCDALWMALPVVAMEGDRMASRMTASMLQAIGRPEWIARDEDRYVAAVVALAGDTGLRDAWRMTGRERMAASPLCDARDLAACLENAYFEMYERRQATDQAPA